MNLPEPRRFNYQFRYYKPENEERKRIHFQRIRKSDPPKRVSSLRVVAMLVVIFIIVFLLVRKAPDFFSPSQENVTLEEIKITE